MRGGPASVFGGVVTALFLGMLVATLCVIFARSVLGLALPWVQEAAAYLHFILIVVAMPFAHLLNRHVRIDIVSGHSSDAMRKLIDRGGFVLFLLPLMALVLFYSYVYVVESWRTLEGSMEVAGLPGVFLLKTLIPVFAGLMIAAGLYRWLRHS